MDFAETMKRLVALQKTDSGLDELDRLTKGFKQGTDALDANVTSLKETIAAEKKNAEELSKQRKTLEIEIGALDGKITKYQGQENEVKSNEQFTALKHEIEKCREDKAKAEEKVLELMFKDDEQKQKLQVLAGQLAQAEKKAVEDKKELLQKIADCDKAAAEKRVERKKQLAEIDQEFAEGYESLRNHGKKIAVAEVQEDQTCSGCHMNVSPQILNEIRKNIAIERCNCGRFLYVKD